jgi:hypothetical protein
MKEAAKWGGLYCYLAASPGSPFGPGGPAGPAGPISPSFPSFPSIPGPPAFPGGPGGPAGPSKHPDRVTAATHKTIKVLIRIVTLSKVERPVSSVGFCRRIDPKRTTPKIKGDHLTERLMESRIWRFMGDTRTISSTGTTSRTRAIVASNERGRHLRRPLHVPPIHLNRCSSSGTRFHFSFVVIPAGEVPASVAIR